MHLYEKEIRLPVVEDHNGLLDYLGHAVSKELDSNEFPIRFVVTKTDGKHYYCELGVVNSDKHLGRICNESLFKLRKRSHENIDDFNAVLLVPTGIGAEIGGHSGDAGPVARLLSSVCDNLITHPNVVNASDINELPENGLYVEGSVISRLLMGTVGLQKVRSNKVLLVIDKHQDKFFYESAINAVSAARAALGLDCPATITMEDKVTMRSLFSSSGRAVGRIDNFERVCEVLKENEGEYDAVALSSVINVPENFHKDYYHKDMINPWGGVEAMLTHAISLLFNIPSAHSPMIESRKLLELDIGVTDPRKAAEIVSVTFLHSILKGLHKSPKIFTDPSLDGKSNQITASDISCIVIPTGCIGLPTLAAMEQGIPVIAVEDNHNRMKNSLDDLPFDSNMLIPVKSYLEAVGAMEALKVGVSLESVRRPMKYTKVTEYHQKEASSLDLLKSDLDDSQEDQHKKIS